MRNFPLPHPLSIALIAGLSLALNAVAQEPPKQADAVRSQLIHAKEDFRKACESADRDLLLAIDEELQVATSDGDFERAKRLKAIKDACEKDCLLPTDSSVIRPRMEYDRQFVEARKAVEEAFDEAMSECTKDGDLTRAGAIQTEKKRWLDLVKSRKTPKTRYQSPVAKGAVRWDGNGHYYKVVNIRGQSLGIAWPVAKTKCEEMGGYLACGETPNELDFLKSLSGGAWTGAYKDKVGKWVWISGVALDGVPRGDGKDFGFAKTDPQGLLAMPEHGLRTVRTWEFICEWDE